MKRAFHNFILWADQFICIYGCGYSGTYADVQAHQAAYHGYGK